MRKSKKTIAILAIIAMVLMMIPVQAFAADNTALTRLSGATRVDTAIAIANSGWANGATNVVVVPANDQNLVDALAVAPLAKQLKAPVLITDKNSLDANVSAEIATLKAANVYAVGALSDAVVGQLKALSGVTVKQVKGADRFATAAQIASMLTSPAGSVVVGYNGLADALSAASYAAANGYAILVANTDGTVPASEAAYEGSKVIVLGGPTLVADIAGATRYYGSDRYATNTEVIKNLSFKYDKVYVANGETLVDALSGAVLAALSNSPIVLANTEGAAAAADVNKNLTSSSQVIAFGGAAVVPDSVVTGVETGSTGSVPSGPVSVQSVKATAANAFQVTFTAAPADTSKVTFAVSFSGTAITVTPTWNDAKTVATLTGSANYAPGTYTVGVKNDTADLGSSTVSVDQQKVATITITSKTLSVVPAGSSNNANIGFATYTVEDQYGNDITSQPLGNNITWTPGIGQLNTTLTKNGVIAIDPIKDSSGNITVPLTQYTTASISGYDTTSYVSTSATLSVSISSGTLSSLTLNKLTSPNNDDFNAGNTAGQWYVDYSALDASGNPTTNYTLVKSAVLSINGGAFLNVQVVQDPNDNNKAAISVQLDTSYSNNLVSDTNVPITVLLTNGASSTLNVTLKKAQVVDSFMLSAPAQMVASQETVAIPFTATDSTGNAITDFSKLDGKVTLSISGGGSIGLVRNSDGSASVQATMPQTPSTGTLSVYLTASVTSTGKYSQLTLNVQQPKKPDTLNVDNTVMIPFFQTGAAESIDFGATYGGFSLNDQYGRAMDITNEDALATYYYVYATLSSGTAVTVDPSHYTAYDSNAIKLNAASSIGDVGGTATIKYEVYSAPGGTTPDPSSSTNHDTLIGKTVTYTVIKDSDITGYTVDKVSDPLKMLPASQISDAALTDQSKSGAVAANVRDNEYAANPYVWGQTSGGAKIVLNPANIVAVSVDSSKFAIEDSTTAANATGQTIVSPNANNFYIYANDNIKTSNPSATSASTTFTVTVKDGNGNYNVASTPITSTTDGSTVSKVAFFTKAFLGNTGIDISGNTVTINITEATGALAALTGSTHHLTRYDNDGSKNQSIVYFRAYDQFGSKAASITMVSLTGSHFSATTSTPVAQVLQDGNGNPYLDITNQGSIANGDYVILTAVSANGKVGTVKIAFKKS